MGDLTANISAYELGCDCNYSDCKSKLSAHMPLVEAMQDAVNHFGRVYGCQARVIITDGNRCKKNNIDIQMKYTGCTREQAEASNSMHMYHIAADHRVEIKQSGEWNIIDPKELYSYYCDKFSGTYGIGLYSNRIHLDTRKNCARW